MKKKGSRKCLAMAAAAVMAMICAGCSSRALEALVPDPGELAEQAVRALVGEKEDQEDAREELPEETAGEAAEELDEESDEETEGSTEPTEPAAKAAGRVVTEEQFLQEYVEQCLEEEWCLYDYHEKNYMVYREPGTSQALCVNDTGMLQEVEYDGIVSSAICDFDRDGHQELLILRLTECVLEGKREVETDLEALMYEVEGEQVKLADQRILLEDLGIEMNEFQTDVFVKNTTEGIRLFCETEGSVFIAADGYFWMLRGLEYDGSRFWELTDKEFSASDWQPEEAYPYVDNARSLGLDVTNLLDISGASTRIVSQDEDTLCLASIRRRVTLEYGDYGFRRFRPGDALEYGYTEIRNQVEGRDSLRLPSPGPGSLAPLRRDTLRTGSRGDSVFPESSSRLLTDAEIAGVPRDQLQTAINEIYARNGRRFKNPEIQAYFDSKAWYWGTVDPEDFDDNMLSKIERKNIEKLVKASGR